MIFHVDIGLALFCLTDWKILFFRLARRFIETGFIFLFLFWFHEMCSYIRDGSISFWKNLKVRVLCFIWSALTGVWLARWEGVLRMTGILCSRLLSCFHRDRFWNNSDTGNSSSSNNNRNGNDGNGNNNSGRLVKRDGGCGSSCSVNGTIRARYYLNNRWLQVEAPIRAFLSGPAAASLHRRRSLCQPS